MGKYIKRTEVVDAFQITKDRMWLHGEWPEWLEEAWRREDRDTGSLCADPNGKHLVLYTDGGPHKVALDNYLVKDMPTTGYLTCVPPAVFEALYEVLEVAHE